MNIYVLHKKRMFHTILPKNISGNYSISDKNENSEDRVLFSVKEQNGKWVAFSNKKVELFIGSDYKSEIVLNEYQLINLKIEGKSEGIIVLVVPVNEAFNEYRFENISELYIGNNEASAINYGFPLLENSPCKIFKKDSDYYVADLGCSYGIFVNGNLVDGQSKIGHGDLIYICGLKIIILNNVLYINNPFGLVVVNPDVFTFADARLPVKEFEPSSQEDEIVLYDRNDYFMRSPSFMQVVERQVFIMDGHPEIPQSKDQPLILTLGPMLTMGMSSMSMVFVSIFSMNGQNGSAMRAVPSILMAVSMLAGMMLWPSLSKKYQKKQDAELTNKINSKYRAYLEKKDIELTEIAKNQQQILLSNNLSSFECYKLIVSKNQNVWMRELKQDNFLNIRLGIGRDLLNIEFQYPEEHFEMEQDELTSEMKKVLDNHKYIDNVPIVISLVEKNIVAITGNLVETQRYLNNLFVQILGLHSYHDLKIAVFTTSENEYKWDYLKKVPHIFKNDKTMRFFASNNDDANELSLYLDAVINQRNEALRDNDRISSFEKKDAYKGFKEYYLIVTDDYESFKNLKIFSSLLALDQNIGFSLLILHPTLANLPTECKLFIGIDSKENGGIFENVLSKDTQKSFLIDQLNDVDYNVISRVLSNLPMKIEGEDFILPKTYGFLEMYEAGNVNQLNCVERWRNNNPIDSLEVPIGLDTSGNKFKLDLHEREHGPHGLIAGMTGSGKSEFIITFILSMAVSYHPDEVQFVLIDYKGGGLVGAFLNKETGISLPHLAGTITNLDKSEIDRALASIQSELKRRQALFNEARDKLNEGTIDIYKYQRFYREGLLSEPLSHLFIISDEFAELKSQQPDFMDELISTARIGRSLGVHLILATQKPSGVVNDQIWSNSKFKICLKVQDARDSNEVIKRNDAAYLKDVGRFYLQVGYDELFAQGQSAYAGLPYLETDKIFHDEDKKLNFINNIGKSYKVIEMPKGEVKKGNGEELVNIVKYLVNVAKKENIKVRQLWKDRLADIIYLDMLKNKYHFQKKPFYLNPVLGEYDDPSTQNQGMYSLDLSGKGNVVIYSSNEKDTIINTIIYSLITSYHTKELNMYILDFDSQTLKMYQNAPQVGDVIFSFENEKINNLFKYLALELETRKRLFQNYSGSYELYCKNSGSTIPNIVLIIHGYDNFYESYDNMESILSKLGREGFKFGIYIIITAIAERSLRLSMRNNFSQIIPLKLPSAMDYNMLLGKKVPALSGNDYRGVVMINDNPYEFQTAVICDVEKRIDHVNSVITSLNTQITEKAPAIKVLPAVVYWSDIIDDGISVDKFPIGICESNLSTSYFDFSKNCISLINGSLPQTLHKFAKEVIVKFVKKLPVKTLVFDAKDNLNLGDIEKTDSTAICNIIFNRERTGDLYVFISSLEKFIETLDPKFKDNMDQMITQISDMKNVHLIFIDRVEDLKGHTYDSWFKRFVPNNEGIYLGSGLGNSTIHELTTSYKELNAVLPPGFGFNIRNGVATRIKVVEGDESGE